jgi:hypothetical protein
MYNVVYNINEKKSNNNTNEIKLFFKLLNFSSITKKIKLIKSPPFMINNLTQDYRLHISKTNKYIQSLKHDNKTKNLLAYNMCLESGNKNKYFNFKEKFIGFELNLKKLVEKVIIELRFCYIFTENTYHNLKKRYTGKKSSFIKNIYNLLIIEHYTGISNNYGKPYIDVPKIKNNTKLNELYKKSIYLIGYPDILSIKSKYYSLYHKYHKHFQSSGSFYSIQYLSGIYNLILPQSYVFIRYAIDKLNTLLNEAIQSQSKLQILLFYPKINYLSMLIPNKHTDVKFTSNKDINKGTDKTNKSLNLTGFIHNPIIEYLNSHKHVIATYYLLNNMIIKKSQNYQYIIYHFSV